MLYDLLSVQVLIVLISLATFACTACVSGCLVDHALHRNVGNIYKHYENTPNWGQLNA